MDPATVTDERRWGRERLGRHGATHVERFGVVGWSSKEPGAIVSLGNSQRSGDLRPFGHRDIFGGRAERTSSAVYSNGAFVALGD